MVKESGGKYQYLQYALTKILSESATLADASSEIIQIICETFEWDYGEMWRVDPDSEYLRLKDVWHISSEKLSAFKNTSHTFAFSKGIGLPGRVWANGKPEWIPDVVVDDNFPRAAIASKLGIHGAIAFPLMRGSEIMGIMAFYSRKIRRIDKNEFDLIADISRRIGAFINHRIAERSLRERSRLASLGADVGFALARSGSLREILQSCVESVVKYCNAAFARIWTLNREENTLILQCSAGIYTHIDGAHSRIPVGMYKIGLIAQERRPHLTNSVIGDPRVHNQAWAEQMGMVAFAGYPLIVEDRLVGVIAMFSHDPLNKCVLDTLASISGVIALGIERRRTEGTRIMLSSILEATTDFVCSFDLNKNIFYINNAGKNILKLKDSLDIRKLKLSDLYTRWAHNVITDEAIPYAIANDVWTGETSVKSSEGKGIPVSQVIIAHKNTEGTVDYFSSIARDITEKKAYESHIMYISSKDPLTNLFNRRRFQEELNNKIKVVTKQKTQGALLLLDIDNFKDINDLLGHNFGDNVLVNIARILREQLYEDEIIARFTGDEFAIIVTDGNEYHVMQTANRIRSFIHNTFKDKKDSTDITVSIGIAFFPLHGQDADTVIACAEIAMYHAKDEGRDRVCAYSPDQKAQIEKRLIWIKRIIDALDEDHFKLYLQPIMDVFSRQIIGYEALLRMVGTNGEIVNPSEFLYFGERFGLASEIDRWVACEAIALVHTLQKIDKPVHLEVNLSGRALNDKKLYWLIKEELLRSGINPALLVFEITETLAIENIVEAERFIKDLNNLGCRFALDDFGVGFSSFYYLKHLPVEFLKIDGGFIKNLPNNHTDQHLVRAMVEIGHGLGKKIIAEHVDKKETLEILRSFEVEYAQGYFIDMPKPLDEILRETGTSVSPKK